MSNIGDAHSVRPRASNTKAARRTLGDPIWAKRLDRALERAAEQLSTQVLGPLANIDFFKRMNDRFGYVGADWVAAELSDRVLYFAQRDAARDYAAHRAGTSLPFGLPNGFRALLAHVSGDEFKLFVQSDAVRRSYADVARGEATAPMKNDVARLRAFAEGLVAAAGQPIAALEEGAPDWETVHHNAFERTRATIRSFDGALTLGTDEVSVSLGIGLLDPEQNDLVLLDQEPRSFPSASVELKPYRLGLNDLNGLVERAIDGAKRRGRNRVMFSDALLDDGGVVLSDLPSHEGRLVRLSLGRSDGVSSGMRFEVHRRAPFTGVVAIVEIGSVEERESSARPVEPSAEPLNDCWVRLVRKADDEREHLPISITTDGGRRVLGSIPRGPKERT
jgi:GGDEF domain-containing protein